MFWNRWKRVALFLIITILLTGCGDSDEETVSGGAASGQAVKSIASGSAVLGDAMLALKSKEYAVQIANGLMTSVVQDFSPDMAAQMTEEGLSDAWALVNTDGEQFKRVEAVGQVQAAENGNYQTVLVTLRYDKNRGKTIQFVYDENVRIAGLWFDEAELSRDTNEIEDRETAVGRLPYEMDGRLMLPAGKEKAPVVLLIAPSDNMDMDGTVGAAGNTPLKDIAEGLADNGVASYRYNRRKQQYPTIVANSGKKFDMLLEDAWYAVDMLYNAQDVDTERIYVLISGEAADYAPALIERKAERLAGVILINSKPVQKTEVYYDNDEKNIFSQANYFMEKNSTFPVMLLQGEADFETPVAEYNEWQTILKGRAHLVCRSYSGLNHYLLPTSGKQDASDYDVKGKVSASVIEDIAKWCKETR